MSRGKGDKKILRSARNKAGRTAKGRYYQIHRKARPKAGPKSKG